MTGALLLSGISLVDAERLPTHLANLIVDVAMQTNPSVAGFLHLTTDPDERPLEVLPVGVAKSKGAFG